MSEKEIGTIGQKYEDRRTGKSGVLVDRNTKYKTLMFQADDGSSFSITNSTFRSSWRKSKDIVEEENVNNETVEPEEVDKPVEEETETKKKTTKERPKKKKEIEQEIKKEVKFVDLSDDDAIKKFIDEVSNVRKLEVQQTPEQLTILVDDEKVFIADNTNEEDVYYLHMLPDLFSFSEWTGIISISTINYKTATEDGISVSFKTKHTNLATILETITEEVKEINLYGYINNKESEETENESN